MLVILQLSNIRTCKFGFVAVGQYPGVSERAMLILMSPWEPVTGWWSVLTVFA